MEEGKISKCWSDFKNKLVRVIIEDKSANFPSKKDGLFIDIDETHIFISVNNEIKPLLRTTIRRIDLKSV